MLLLRVTSLTGLVCLFRILFLNCIDENLSQDKYENVNIVDIVDSYPSWLFWLLLFQGQNNNNSKLVAFEENFL